MPHKNITFAKQVLHVTFVIKGPMLEVMWCLEISGQSRGWPRGLMDKASDFGSEDCEFESRRGRGKFFMETPARLSERPESHLVGVMWSFSVSESEEK